MNYQKRQLSRRLALGGAGTLLGLPFLESVLPRSARADVPKVPVRLVFIFVPNGIDMATFRPMTAGRAYELSPMLAGMTDLKADFSVVTGLANEPADPGGSGDHGSGTGAFITCARLNRSPTDIKNGISADQLVAQQRDKMLALPSLELGIDGGGTAGACDQEYSCAYSRNISWRDAVTPMPKIVDPRQAFDRLFMSYDPKASATDVAKRRAYDQSVLDFVLADVGGLKPKLGSNDQKKLDQYLSGVRDLEKGLVQTGSGVSCNKGTPSPSVTPALDYPAHIAAMFDLIELAFTCDATRIVTLMFGNAVSGRTHPFLGSTGAHHNISHHKGNKSNLDQLAKIGKWEVDRLGDLMRKLKKPDPLDSTGQSVLYNSAIFWSSDVSDGDMHNHDDKPILLAGHGGGALHPGQHVMYPGGTINKPAPAGQPREKVANLLVTMAAAAGVPNPQLGDSTHVLTEV